MSQFTGYIYKITNKMNNNFYIGQTKTSISKRFISHKCESIHQAAKELSIQPNGICLNCKGKLKTTGGYIFKYVDLL